MCDLFGRKAKKENVVLLRKVEGLNATISRLSDRLRPIPPPEIIAEIDAQNMYLLLKKTFPNLAYADMDLADRTWGLTTPGELERFIAADNTDEMIWRTQAPDCDDFTRRLRGNLVIPGWWSIPAGDIWVQWEDTDGVHGHSVMITVLVDEAMVPTVYLVEGQDDVIETAEEMFEDFAITLLKI